MLKGFTRIAALTAVAVLGLAGHAQADTTLGSTAIPNGSDAGACGGGVIAQVNSDPSTPYTVPSPGTITSWQINTVAAAPGTPITLVVLRSTGGTNYTVVGADTHNVPNPLPGIASFSVGTPIPVNGGEILALFAGGSDVVCYFHEGSTPLTDALISLGTASTPAPGQSLAEDDFSGGGYTLNLAANLKAPTPPVKKKKCKKKKKHKRSADSAKKKKCKKKKKR